MAAGLGGAAPPAGPHWTVHPPGSRGLSWRHRFTHKTAQSERNIDCEFRAYCKTGCCTQHLQSVNETKQFGWHMKEKWHDLKEISLVKVFHFTSLVEFN